MPTIILTRADDDNERTARELRRDDWRVESAPMIELRPIEHDRAELEALAHATIGAIVLLTSAHATRRWLELRHGAFAAATPSGYLVVGASSAALLAAADPSIPVLAVATSAAGLASVLPPGITRVLYPCSTARRDEAIAMLTERSVDVIELPLYEPRLPDGAAARLERILAAATPPTAIVFFSPSAVANWFSLRSDIPSDSIFVAIGPTTAEALRALGVERITTAGGGTGESLVEAIDRSLARGA